MATIRQAAEVIAAAVNAHPSLGEGVTVCHVDPAAAYSNRPCLLVAPPVIDYTTRRSNWRLIALASRPHGDLPALDELDVLVSLASEVQPVERAEPGQYPLGPSGDVAACYVLTLTTT